MDRRLTTTRVSIISTLAVYLIIGTVLTGVLQPIGVLVLVLVAWFSVYKLRHKGLGNRELITRMGTDLRVTLEGIEDGLARQEENRRATAEQEEHAYLKRERRRAEREKRRASSPTEDPAATKYADMIQSKVRKRKVPDDLELP
jgi:hypothetical protein